MAVIATTTLVRSDVSDYVTARHGFMFAVPPSDCQVFIYEASGLCWHVLQGQRAAGICTNPRLDCTLIEADMFGVKVGVIVGCNQWVKKALELLEAYFPDLEFRKTYTPLGRSPLLIGKHPYKIMLKAGDHTYFYRPAINREERAVEEKQLEKQRARSRAIEINDAISPFVDEERRLIMKLGREALIDMELANSLQEIA